MTILTNGVVPASELARQPASAWLATWSQFAAELRYDDLPPDVVERGKLVVLDCLGAVIAGRAEPEVRSAAARFAHGDSALIEAFLDGTAGTMLEIDEGNQYARGHPGIHVVPAVLAAARRSAMSGRDAIVATVLGYEIGARIGIASKLLVTMHPHGTWGTVGAALAVAKLAGATVEEIARVINVSASLGLTTSRRNMLEGGTVRNTYAGFSNMLGSMAWDLVKAGFTGERDGVATVFGTVAASDWRPEEMIRDLGTRWEIARNYFKRHAACRYTHGALDALADILRRSGPIAAERIACIEVDTYVWAAQLDDPAPANMLAAKFSLPFALAAAIVSGGATLDAFRPPALDDGVTRALAARIVVREDLDFTALLPSQRPARVRLTTVDGAEYLAEVTTNRGDTEDPYTSDEVLSKFREVVTPSVGAATAERLAASVMALDRAPDLSALIVPRKS